MGIDFMQYIIICRLVGLDIESSGLLRAAVSRSEKCLSALLVKSLVTTGHYS